MSFIQRLTFESFESDVSTYIQKLVSNLGHFTHHELSFGS